MSARDERPAEAAGVVLALLAIALLLAAPIGVMLGQSAVEMAVVAIAGVGVALLHLAVVVAVHMRALARVRSTHHIVSVGGGGGGGVGSSSGGAGGAGNPGRPPR